MENYYEENKRIYKTIMVTKRVAELLRNEQDKLGLTQVQMAQKLDIALQTYKCLINPYNTSNVKLETLAKIWENSDITYDDVFEGIYRSRYGKKEI